jgi:hypothetical protein
MRDSFKIFYQDIRNSFRDLLPIVIVVAIFQTFIIQSVPENLTSILLGLFIVAIGLAFFMRGLELGIFPIGESLAVNFAKKGSVVWLLIFAFTMGFSSSAAEPALMAIATKASDISNGLVDAFWLRITVAFSVGVSLMLSIWRILKGYPIANYVIIGYIIAICVTFFAPKEIIGLAYDSGGVTTSTVTVPLVAALGIGLASSIKGRNPMMDGFGVIALAALAPIIFVQLYGIFVYSFSDLTVVVQEVATKESLEIHTFIWSDIFWDLLAVIRDVTPILAVIFFFQFVIIKKPIAHFHKVITGIILVVLGLYAFIVGLEMGLFPIGESMALQLTTMNNNLLIYSFAFFIGFSTTMAEPALLAVAIKAQEVSGGGVHQGVLRFVVAFGGCHGYLFGKLSYYIRRPDTLLYYCWLYFGYYSYSICSKIYYSYCL